MTKLFRLVIDIPVDLELAGLEQTRHFEREKRWRAYLRLQGRGFLQGAYGATAQEAIDATVALIRASPEPAPLGEVAPDELDL